MNTFESLSLWSLCLVLFSDLIIRSCQLKMFFHFTGSFDVLYLSSRFITVSLIRIIALHTFISFRVPALRTKLEDLNKTIYDLKAANNKTTMNSEASLPSSS